VDWANAILIANPNCEVIVVEKYIPCNIGDFFSLNLNKHYNYIVLSNILQVHSCGGSPEKPHGQGFILVMNINLADKLN
jgi:hypothetical protein